MDKRKRKFVMFSMFLIAILGIVLGVKIWIKTIPPKIESGETLIFYDGFTYDGKLEVWYPLEKYSETYDIGETLRGVSFINKKTVLAISSQREAVVEYDVENHSFAEICSLKYIAEGLFQATGINISPDNLTAPGYVGEKYLSFLCYPEDRSNPRLILLYDLQHKTVNIIGYTFSMRYQIDETKLRYEDATTHEIVEINTNNLSEKATSQISLSISHSDTMGISDDSKLVSLDTGDVIASFEQVKNFSPTDFTFSSDDQYIAFYYLLDEPGRPQIGRACVYDWKKDRLYTFSTKEFMTYDAKIDWLPA